MDSTVARRATQLIDRHGNAVIVVQQNRPVQVVLGEHVLEHGWPGHVCRPVYPWQREFWGRGVHTGRHDCPDGGCK